MEADLNATMSTNVHPADQNYVQIHTIITWLANPQNDNPIPFLKEDVCLAVPRAGCMEWSPAFPFENHPTPTCPASKLAAILTKQFCSNGIGEVGYFAANAVDQ